jgi:hypothetical protein
MDAGGVGSVPSTLVSRRRTSVPDSQKSFFSGLSGVITGLAAIASAIVGLIGLSVNQGWIGGHAKSAGSGSTAGSGGSTVPGSPQTSLPGSPQTGIGGIGDTSVPGPQFAVDPTSLVFNGAIGPKDATVKVLNPGVLTINVQPPVIKGPDASRFSASPQDCSSPVEPGRSCLLKVTFNPPGPGTSNAVLVVQVSGVTKAQEVPIQATAIL